MILQPANDILKRLERIVPVIGLSHINVSQLHCFRSTQATTRAIARIWSFPKIWQMALNEKAHYSIEVISQRFDKLSDEDKDKVLIHELLHIPKNFSGALLPHRRKYGRIDRKTVDFYYQKLSEKKR